MWLTMTNAGLDQLTLRHHLGSDAVPALEHDLPCQGRDYHGLRNVDVVLQCPRSIKYLLDGITW